MVSVLVFLLLFFPLSCRLFWRRFSIIRSAFLLLSSSNWARRIIHERRKSWRMAYGRVKVNLSIKYNAPLLVNKIGCGICGSGMGRVVTSRAHVWPKHKKVASVLAHQQCIVFLHYLRSSCRCTICPTQTYIFIWHHQTLRTSALLFSNMLSNIWVGEWRQRLNMYLILYF